VQFGPFQGSDDYSQGQAGNHFLFLFNSNHSSICLHFSDTDNNFSRSRQFWPLLVVVGPRGPEGLTSKMGFYSNHMPKNAPLLPYGHGKDIQMDRQIAALLNVPYTLVEA